MVHAVEPYDGSLSTTELSLKAHPFGLNALGFVVQSRTEYIRYVLASISCKMNDFRLKEVWITDISHDARDF